MAENFSNNSGSRKSYYSLQAGRLTRKAKDGEDGIPIGDKQGLYVQPDSITGTLTSMIIKEIEFDTKDGKKKTKVLELELHDGVDILVLSFPVASKFFKTFASKIENVSFRGELTVKPYAFVDKEGKKVSGINLFQGDVKVEYFYTKENPGKRPAYPEAKMDDDEFKIFDLQLTKYYVGVINQIASKLDSTADAPKPAENKPKTRKEIVDKAKQSFEDAEPDDLPF